MNHRRVCSVFPRLRFGLVSSMFAVAAMYCRAESLPHYSPRELTAQAALVVRGQPLEKINPRRFRVTEVLRGKSVRRGDTIELNDLGLHEWTIIEDAPLAGPTPKHTITDALLFLAAGAKKGEFSPVMSGLRFLGEDGAVLVPRQVRNPGGYALAAHRDVRWDEIVRAVRADGAALDRLDAARALARPAARNRAVLGWLKDHARELNSSTGWGVLEEELIASVLDSGVPEDAWEAARIDAALNKGHLPQLREPVFGSVAGRRLLLSMARDTDRTETDRVLALDLIGHPQTLWPGDGGKMAAVRATSRELDDLTAALEGLLKDREPGVRAAAARALTEVAGGLKGAALDRVRDVLVSAYKIEGPTLARAELATGILMIGGPALWQKVGGNPQGLLGRLRDLGRRDGLVFFWLELRSERLPVHEPPMVLLERLDGRRVVESKEQPLPVAHLPRPWAEGWNGASALLVEMPTRDLKPGTWRITVRGSAGKGKDRATWTAEPMAFVLPPPRDGEPVYISDGQRLSSDR